MLWREEMRRKILAVLEVHDVFSTKDRVADDIVAAIVSNEYIDHFGPRGMPRGPTRDNLMDVQKSCVHDWNGPQIAIKKGFAKTCAKCGAGSFYDEG